MIAVDLDEADLDTGADLDNADPGDFGDLDADDADLQATLTVLAVLGRRHRRAAGVADDLAGDTGGPDVPEEPEGLEELRRASCPPRPMPRPEGPGAAGERVAGLSPEAGGEEEIFVVGDDDDDLPAAQVAVAGATADPVKDYLKQIGKVALLNAEEEVELAKRIEAGLYAEEKLAEPAKSCPATRA